MLAALFANFGVIEEGYDDVYAKRISRDGETILKKLTSKIFYKVIRI